MKEGKGAPDCFKQLFVSVYVCVDDVGMATWSVTAGPLVRPLVEAPPPTPPPPDVQLLSRVCLCLRSRGRNYTGDDPVLLKPPAFQVELSFVNSACFILLPVLPPVSSHLSCFTF